MPLLSRNTPHLLRSVSGHTHATDEDHERDPESSSDELELTEINTSKKNGTAENTNWSPSIRRAAKRKSDVIKDPQSTLKKQKSNDDLVFNEMLTMDQPRRVAKKLYGGTRYEQEKSPLKNIHAEGKKGKGRGKSNEKENMEPKPARIFKSPPKPQRKLPSIREPSKFIVPPKLESGQPLKSEVGMKFRVPPSETLPRTRSGRVTRSKARSITPETSHPINIASSSLDSISPNLPIDATPEVDSTCPTCNAIVPDDLISEWRARYPKMSIRVQQKFCQEHTVRSAREAWEARHPYHPSIIDVNWKGLDERLQSLRSEMMWLIERPEKSFFRKQFERTVVDTGRSRTLLKAIIGSGEKSAHLGNSENISDGKQDNSGASVGYYGTKGLKMM
jgi:hypothetical protein